MKKTQMDPGESCESGNNISFHHLLERIAVLTTEIKQQLDTCKTEFRTQLLSKLLPQLTRPYPSYTIIQFRPQIRQLQSSYCIEKSTSVYSDIVGNHIDKIECEFKTTQPVIVNPITVENISANTIEEQTELILKLSVDQNATPSKLDWSNFKLYINDNHASALSLYFILINQVRSVRIKFSENDQINISTENRAYFIPKNDCGSGGPHSEFSTIQDYLMFPENYLFVQLNGLNDITWPAQIKQFEICIYLNSILPSQLKLSRTSLLLHCTPAINLFDTTSEPIPHTPNRSEHPVVVDSNHPDSVLLYSILKVSGMNGYNKASYYNIENIQTRIATPNRQPFSYISLPENKNSKNLYLSCKIKATNGNYPYRFLATGSIRNSAKHIPNYISITNITKPTPYHEPPDLAHLAESLISTIIPDFLTNLNAKKLREILLAHEWAGTKTNEHKTRGITSLASEKSRIIRQGMPWTMLTIEIKFDEAFCEGFQEVFLLGSILHYIFTERAAINIIVKTVAHCHPSSKEFTWKSHP